MPQAARTQNRREIRSRWHSAPSVKLLVTRTRVKRVGIVITSVTSVADRLPRVLQAYFSKIRLLFSCFKKCFKINKNHKIGKTNKEFLDPSGDRERSNKNAMGIWPLNF